MSVHFDVFGPQGKLIFRRKKTLVQLYFLIDNESFQIFVRIRGSANII